MYEYLQLETVGEQEFISDETLNHYAKDGWRVISVNWWDFNLVGALLERRVPPKED